MATADDAALRQAEAEKLRIIEEAARQVEAEKLRLAAEAAQKAK